MRQLFMQSDVNPVTPGIHQAGWVSGSCVGVTPAAGRQIVFDLGPDWAEFQRIQMNVYLPTGGANNVNYTPFGGDTPALDLSRRFIFALSTVDSSGVYIQNTVVNTSKICTLIPQGRYINILFNNDVSSALNTVAGTFIIIQAFQY